MIKYYKLNARLLSLLLYYGLMATRYIDFALYLSRILYVHVYTLETMQHVVPVNTNAMESREHLMLSGQVTY